MQFYRSRARLEVIASTSTKLNRYEIDVEIGNLWKLMQKLPPKSSTLD